MLNRNIQSDNTIVIEMVRNDTDGMICFYGVNKRCIDGLECLNTWKRDLKKHTAALSQNKEIAAVKTEALEIGVLAKPDFQNDEMMKWWNFIIFQEVVHFQNDEMMNVHHFQEVVHFQNDEMMKWAKAK